jgi:Protein of unknown function (DUF1446).
MEVNLSPQQRTVRIGGASGFWGDSSVGAPQLVASGQIDYLVFDYLAELTMSILAAARQKNAALGYATDFVTVAMRAVLKDVVQRGIRVVSNAGGVNPQACAAALQTLAEELGVNVKIAVVTGDDVMPLIPQLREAKEPVRELQSGVPLPERVVTANAYLGALPVKAASGCGGQRGDHRSVRRLCRDIGRVDARVRLVGGRLRSTRGRQSCWPHHRMRLSGYRAVSSPTGTLCPTGRTSATRSSSAASTATSPSRSRREPVASSRRRGRGADPYEIGDPSAYLLPDVTCDFTGVTLNAEGPDRVSVSGARGRAPTSTYKVCATYVDGFKLSAQLTIVGFDADAKARRTGEAILERTSELLKRARTRALHRDDDRDARRGILLRTPCARGGTREAVLRLTATHRDKAALELLAREVAPAGTSWAPARRAAAAALPLRRPSVNTPSCSTNPGCSRGFSSTAAP